MSSTEVTSATSPELARIAGRYDLARRCVPALYIVAFYIPLRAVQPIADAMAGKDTNVSVSIGVSITISVVLSATVVTLLLKSRAQGRELTRLRQRITELEGELESPG